MSIENWKNKKIKGSEFTTFNYDQDALYDEIYPYAMICFILDQNTMIAVSSGEESPRQFMENSKNKYFLLDTSIPPKKNILTMNGQKTIYYAKETN
jgi:hypothetical protein|tara:strand:- start:88 stop:375 length:288 start_codon:yes stop_codon:yes gene_type:complete